MASKKGFLARARNPRVSSFLLVLSVVSSMLITACSPGMFSRGPEGGSLQVGTYRRINRGCAGMTLASSQIDVPTVRQMLACFNAEGGLEPLQRLVNRLSDADLQPLVDISNRHLLSNSSAMYQLEATYQQLKERGLLDSALLQVSRILENSEFISTGISLLRRSYFIKNDRDGLQENQEVLRLLEHFAQKLSPQKLGTTLDSGMELASAPAFQALTARFKGGVKGEVSSAELINLLLTYLAESQQPGGYDPVRDIAKVILNGQFFRAIDSELVLGTEPEQFKTTIPRVAAVMALTAGIDSRAVSPSKILMDDVSSLFHYMNQPISCLGGAKVVPNGALHVIREMVSQNAADASTFVRRDNVLLLAAMSPFCQYPSALGRYYPSMSVLAESNAYEPMTDLIKAFYRISEGSTGSQRPLIDLLVKLLGSTGERDDRGIKRLSSHLRELTLRGVWSDAFLVAGLLRVEDRGDLNELIRFLMDPAEKLQGKAPYDVLSRVMANTNPVTLLRFVRSFDRYLERPDALLVPALQTIRDAYYANNVHPLVNLSKDLLSQATQNVAFYNTLFRISDLPEFREVLDLVAEVSRTGELTALMDSVFTIFHRFSEQGAAPITQGQAPRVRAPRHLLTAADLRPFVLGPARGQVAAACTQVDPLLRLDHYTHPRYSAQISNMLSCYNSDGTRGHEVRALEFLRQERTSDGRSYFDFQIDLVKQLGLSQREIQYLSDQWIYRVDSGEFYSLLDAVPYAVRRHYGSNVIPRGPVLQPLIELVSPLMAGARTHISALMSYGATVLRKPEIPAVLSYLENLVDQKPEPSDSPQITVHDLPRLERWITNKECFTLPSEPAALQRALRTRTRQIIDDYENAVTTYDYLPDPSRTGKYRQRQAWSKADLRQALEPILRQIGDRSPQNNASHRNLMDALMNFVQYFTLEPGQSPNSKQHFTPDLLVKWLHKRSTDAKLVTYMEPGDGLGNGFYQQRVRMMNTMDRLEVVVLNADFMAPIYNTNFGLKSLAIIAEAWGDEPFNVWPEDIQRRFTTRPVPTTLQNQYRVRTALELGLAMGQRPFKDWPSQVKAVFATPTGEPMLDLAGAVSSVIDQQTQSENLVGFPQMPICRQVANPRDPADLQWAETHDPQPASMGPPDWLLPVSPSVLADSRLRIYNMRGAIDVLQENIPTQDDPGMRVLRNLFFELYYSSAEDARSPTAGDRNHLSTLLKLERLGLTHQIARWVRRFEANDPVLNDFFTSLMKGAGVPELKDALEVLLSEDQDQSLVWKIVDQVFDLIHAGEGTGPLGPVHQAEIDGKSPAQANRIRASWRKEYLRAKQMGLYLMAHGGQSRIAEGMIRSALPILRQYREYLESHSDRVLDLVRTDSIAYFARALYESQDLEGKARLNHLIEEALDHPEYGVNLLAILQVLDNDPGISVSGANSIPRWKLFWERFKLLRDDPAFQDLQTTRLLKEMLHFIEEKSEDPAGVETARRLRFYLADRLEKGDAEQLLLLMTRSRELDGHRVDFYDVLDALAGAIENGQIKDFFALSRRALGN